MVDSTTSSVPKFPVSLSMMCLELDTFCPELGGYKAESLTGCPIPALAAWVVLLLLGAE